jgi:hypothetical protein
VGWKPYPAALRSTDVERKRETNGTAVSNLLMVALLNSVGLRFRKTLPVIVRPAVSPADREKHPWRLGTIFAAKE